MNDYPYYFAWKNNPKRATLYKRELKVLARGAMNSALVEFENGQREVISRNALRRRTKLAIDPASAEHQLPGAGYPPQVIRDWVGEDEDKAWAHLDNPPAHE